MIPPPLVVSLKLVLELMPQEFWESLPRKAEVGYGIVFPRTVALAREWSSIHVRELTSCVRAPTLSLAWKIQVEATEPSQR